MKTKYLKVAFILAALVGGLAIWMRPSAQAQGDATQLSTNWVGSLVVGKEETGDRIAGRGPFPRAEAGVQIGLRSDGVVIWRKGEK